MKTKNAKEVLENVESLIVDLENMANRFFPNPRYRIVDVYNDVNIFDWWNDRLSKSQLQDMRKFLREAIKLGYTGYVCFKVGATGCANGMWAYKEESTTGYSPDGEALYKSFTPEYNYWSFCDAEGQWSPARENFDSVKTVKQLEELLRERMTK